METRNTRWITAGLTLGLTFGLLLTAAPVLAARTERHPDAGRVLLAKNTKNDKDEKAKKARKAKKTDKTERANPGWRDEDRNENDRARSGSRPPGWDKGNKTGWRGRDVPPGQAKKRGDDPRETRDTRDRNRNGIPDYQEVDRDRDGTPDYRDNWVDVNRDGVDDRRDRDEDRAGATRTVSGTVVDTTGRTDRRISVRLSNGRIERYDVPRGAIVARHGKPISIHEVRSGDRVTVYLSRNSNGTYRVTSLKVG